MDRTSLIGLLFLTFAGGILGSLGVSTLLRSKRGRAMVGSWKWWGMTLYFLAVGAAIAGVVAWAYYSMVRNVAPDELLGSPWLFVAFGFAAGLPFTLSSAVTVWRDGRQAKGRSRRRKAKPASRQERAEFAKNLERQLREYSDDLRDAKVIVQGQDGTVVAIHGDIKSGQAEKLVNVLRGELQDLGFQRVESGDAERKWWVRV